MPETYNDKVILVKRKNKPVSVGVGRFCFSIENARLVEDPAQANGAKFVNKFNEYLDALNLAYWAFCHDCYDMIEEHW
jgi:hypothetical protein